MTWGPSRPKQGTGPRKGQARARGAGRCPGTGQGKGRALGQGKGRALGQGPSRGRGPSPHCAPQRATPPSRCLEHVGKCTCSSCCTHIGLARHPLWRGSGSRRLGPRAGQPCLLPAVRRRQHPRPDRLGVTPQQRAHVVLLPYDGAERQQPSHLRRRAVYVLWQFAIQGDEYLGAVLLFVHLRG